MYYFRTAPRTSKETFSLSVFQSCWPYGERPNN